jgi:hypothetical protein
MHVALALAVLAEKAGLLIDFFIIGSDHAALTGGHVLGGVERKTAYAVKNRLCGL